MLPTASMATHEPILSPWVLSPWQTSRAPPTRSTSAMWSGERNPSGGECKVVNETTSPPPITEVGVISTGWRGHQRDGGAATSRHSGQREAARCSIMSARFQDRDPVVGAWPADRMGQRDVALDLAPGHAPRQLPHALDDLRQPGRREWMPPCLEPARRVDRQTPPQRRLAVERRRAGLAGREEPDVLERDDLERGKRVVDLGDVDPLGAEARHRECGARGHLGSPKARQALAVPEG